MILVKSLYNTYPIYKPLIPYNFGPTCFGLRRDCLRRFHRGDGSARGRRFWFLVLFLLLSLFLLLPLLGGGFHALPETGLLRVNDLETGLHSLKKTTGNKLYLVKKKAKKLKYSALKDTERGKWVAKLVPKQGISQKHKMDNIKEYGGQHTLAHQNNLQKKDIEGNENKAEKREYWPVLQVGNKFERRKYSLC
jgi:hypothetical protein